MKKHILIIDDDPHIREVIEFAIQKGGFETSTAKDGAEGLAKCEEIKPDLVILDVGMPEMDGLDVCREIRKSSEVPVLFLSARDEEIDRIIGLEIGGDDYVTKPFSPRELLARVNVILKRVNQFNPESVKDEVLIQGEVTLDCSRRTVTISGAGVSLTGTEFDILAVLMCRPGVVFNRAQLLELAWPENIHVSDRTIDSHVRNLRAKLKMAGVTDGVNTVHGVGFRLGSCEAAEIDAGVS